MSSTSSANQGSNLSGLAAELDSIGSELAAHLAHAGFSREQLLSFAARLASSQSAPTTNRISGTVEAPNSSDISRLPPSGSDRAKHLTQLGEVALSKGELAFCVMAGGMATRMGGVVKALVEVLPGETFLDVRLLENALWSARCRNGVLPLWLMTSEATEHPIGVALRTRNAPGHIVTFPQFASLRLTPEGLLFRDENGRPSPYATGHGDLPDALRRSGLLARFLEEGGKYVWITNLDNLGATVDPLVLGHFIDERKQVMVEVCEKADGDRGGVPVWTARTGSHRLEVLEEFRLPEGFDANSVRVFNTNTFLVDARALHEHPVHWTYFQVTKHVAGRKAIQFERLLQELTAELESAYVAVPREGVEARFLPVKDPAELEQRRAAIKQVLSARKLLPPG